MLKKKKKTGMVHAYNSSPGEGEQRQTDSWPASTAYMTSVKIVTDPVSKN